MLGLHTVSVTLHGGLQLVLSKTIKINETEYNIYCSCLSCLSTLLWTLPTPHTIFTIGSFRSLSHLVCNCVL